MDVREAVDAHLQAVVTMSSFGDPREILEVGQLRVMRDAPGRKRPPRKDQFVICDVDPADAVKAIRDYKPNHWGLSVIASPADDFDRMKTQYKSSGYRFMCRLPFFGYDLGHAS